MAYLIYLRKSRADTEAEARGEGETLARHEKTLIALAKKLCLPVGAIYKEIVSGETIAARPEMQKLLSEVDAGKWEGVIVMEVERLARGNTLDQGIVANAFKYSHTKIITPVKTYDPNNEYDEEYFEFSLFMSRREYKTINRRLQAGRLAVIKEGAYMGTRDPFGYKRYKRDDGKYSLQIVEEEAEIVRLIYNWYTSKDWGTTIIANRLNNMGVKPQRSDRWTAGTVRDIIRNPVHKGYIVWGKKPEVKSMNGKISRPKVKYPEIQVQGLHAPIVSAEIWDCANNKYNKNHSHTSYEKHAVNPLAGLIKCGFCGKAMIMKNLNDKSPLFLFCATKGCPCVGNSGTDVVNIVLSEIERAYAEYELEPLPDDNSRENYLLTEKNSLEKELRKIDGQIEKSYDFLEQGVYTTEIFTERQTVLSQKKKKISARIDELTELQGAKVDTAKVKNAAKRIIDTYNDLETVEEKNKLLKTIVKRIEYKKTSRLRSQEGSDLKICIEFLF